MGEQVVVGMRPGDFEHEQIVGADPDRTVVANIDVVEVLGSETFVHYNMPSPPVVTPDIEELLADTGAEVSSLGSETKFASRISSDVMVRPGDQLNLVVDTTKLHFFDPADGDRVS